MKNILIIIFMMSFYSCISTNQQTHQKIGNYLLIKKYVYESKCKRPAKIRAEFIKNNLVLQIYKGNLFDNYKSIKKFSTSTFYEKKTNNYKIILPIHQFKKNESVNIKFVNNKIYLDKIVPLTELLNMKNDTIFMDLLPKYNCSDLELKNAGKIIK